MNKYIKSLIVIIFLPAGAVMAVFLAQTLAIDARVVAQQDNMQQRVEQYKVKLQNQPSKGDLDKIKLRCSVMQDRVKILSKKVVGIKQKRIDSYNSINKSLTDLTQVLKDKHISTTTIEANSKELKGKTDTFAEDILTFSQALEDVSSIDCTNDPLGVKAGIESARIDHVKLIQEVADIRVYINNVVKVTLTQVKQDLVTQEQANIASEGAPSPADPTQPTDNGTSSPTGNSQPQSTAPSAPAIQPQNGGSSNAAQ